MFLIDRRDTAALARLVTQMMMSLTSSPVRTGPGRRTLYTIHERNHRNRYAGMGFCSGEQECRRRRERLLDHGQNVGPASASSPR